METMKTTYFCIAAALTLAACSDPDYPNPGRPDLPETSATALRTERESGAYSLFFKPAIGWVGDAMPFFDPASGRFHVFYLQDWREAGPIHPYWVVETDDFARFDGNRLALSNGTAAEQDEALGTGSVIRGNDGTYYCFYTGEKSTNYVEGNPRQAVMRATSTDLKTWTKDPAFGLLSASPDYHIQEFRDPCVFWDADCQLYRMVVASDYHGYDYKALAHYTSPDLFHWTLRPEPLVKTTRTFMECPDVFKMGDYWYVLYSSIEDPRTVQYIYRQGSLDDDTPWSEPVSLDGRNYYAAKTAVDKEGNRYLSGWCQTFEGEYDSSGWGGSLVTHRLVQAGPTDPTLLASMPEAIGQRLAKPLALTELERSARVEKHAEGDYTLQADEAATDTVLLDRLATPSRLTLTVQRLTDDAVFGLAFGAGSNADRLYNLRFLVEPSVQKYDLAFESNGRHTDGWTQYNWRSLWDVKDETTYRLTLCMEKSVLVAYVNDRLAFSCRCYQLDQNPWMLFVERGKVRFQGITLLGD